MPSSAISVDSPRVGNLSDVPEDSVLSSSRGSSRTAVNSPYMHPSLSTSSSTFKYPATASTSSLASAVARQPMGPRNPGSIRAASTASLHTLDPGIQTPGTPTGGSSASSPTASVARKKKSTSSVRDPKGERGADRAERTERTTERSVGKEKEREEKGEENEGDAKEKKEPVKKVNKSGRVALSAEERARRTTPSLPHSTSIAVAPPTLMYWSKAPVYGLQLPKVRAHTVTLVDNIVWLFGGCDEQHCFKELWWFNTGKCVYVLVRYIESDNRN